MGFLPSCDCVSTTVLMHYLDSNETHGEKGRWKLHQNATCYFEQILEATFYKTAAVCPYASHLTNHPNKRNKTCGEQLEK